MGDVFIRVSADTASAVQNLLKVAQGEEKIGESAKKARAHVGELEKAFRDIGKNIGDLEGGLAGLVRGFNFNIVEKLSESVKELYDDWKRAKEAAKEYQRQIFDIAAAEDLRKLPEIKALFDSTKASGVSREQKLDIYQGLGKDLSGQELQEAFRATVQQAPMISAGKSKDFAELVGSVRNMLPKMEMGDVMDIAVKTFQSFKGDLSKFDKKSVEQLLSVGMRPEEAFGTAISFGKTEQGSKALQKLVDLSLEKKEFPALKFGEGLTDEEQKTRAFYGVNDPLSRLNQLMADRGLRQKLMGGQFAEADIGMGGMDEQVMGVKRAIVGNRAQSQLQMALAPQSRELQKLMAERQVDEAMKDENVVVRNSGIARALMRNQIMDSMDQAKGNIDTEAQLSDETVNRLIEALNRNTDATEQNSHTGGANAHTE